MHVKLLILHSNEPLAVLPYEMCASDWTREESFATRSHTTDPANLLAAGSSPSSDPRIRRDDDFN
jgi:hypothetical protein